jgi:hypothetical protein
LPTALIFAPGEPVSERALGEHDPQRAVVLPASTRHPEHPTATIAEYHSAVVHVDDVLERL